VMTKQTDELIEQVVLTLVESAHDRTIPYEKTAKELISLISDHNINKLHEAVNKKNWSHQRTSSAIVAEFRELITGIKKPAD